jgi:hypothetical protein
MDTTPEITLFAAVRAFVTAVYGPHEMVKSISIKLASTDEPLSLPMPAGACPPVATPSANGVGWPGPSVNGTFHRFTPVEKAILQALTDEPQSAEELARRAGYAVKTVRNCISDLQRVEPPVIRRTPDGYRRP